MTNIQHTQTNRRARRIRAIRAVVRGTAERPRLAVERTALHFRAQLIDDTAGKTLASASDATLKTKVRVSSKPRLLVSYSLNRPRLPQSPQLSLIVEGISIMVALRRLPMPHERTVCNSKECYG